MHQIQHLQQLVNQAIAGKTFKGEPAELYDPINYIMSLGGKRLRPVLLLMATDLFSGSVLKALEPAVAIELFHNFTLVHDDIMDKAPLRRGKPTVHAKWNENVAILSGDVMLVEAYRLMMNTEDQVLRQVLDVFNETAAGVCRGQQIDMNFEQEDGITIPEYLEMIRLKTAVLLAASLRIGALLGGAAADDAGKLYKFGESLGIAFQLQDDILDVYGDPEKFGKQTGGDIIANKKTWLLLKSRELAEGLDEEELNYWFNESDAGPSEKVRAVTAVFDRLGIRTLAEAEMNDHAEHALQQLEAIPVPAERKKLLREFAEQLLVREN
ncbi:polyprenyl synthetase family protein [Hufsiella ginkgonis]|uniref:Polyprenyl synthetase family protein n=1 Tax=Hufsiella ginkgonis TaxID=2695274 RepID=A0A7K1XZN3_9SPHI|nr:polyprenyl synthetase family protein [Hufsiella ginkgonis]MXV16268.1 polyprenyl synthetase family protein [Hufsiella ginkgonis]